MILDTNVVSEPMKPRPNPAVSAWLNSQAIGTMFIAATSVAELLLGARMTPEGKRKRELIATVSEQLEVLFGPRVLPFDGSAAAAYGSLVSAARSRGRVVGVADGQIGAIAYVHGFTVVTRDAVPFQALGVPLINPWAQ
jgi:predicted nucleic acid-binding protein